MNSEFGIRNSEFGMAQSDNMFVSSLYSYFFWFFVMATNILIISSQKAFIGSNFSSVAKSLLFLLITLSFSFPIHS